VNDLNGIFGYFGIIAYQRSHFNAGLSNQQSVKWITMMQWQAI
jgi:hypothetical protein